MFGSLGCQGFAAPPAVHVRASASLNSGPTCVLAPIIKVKFPSRPPVVPDSIQQRVSSAFASSANQILTFVRLWRDDGKLDQEDVIQGAAQELLRDKADRAVEATEQGTDATKGARLPPPDISSYLRPAGLMETRYVRLLSSLCAQTYYLSKMTPRTLYRRHRLQLVTSSLACERFTVEVPRTAAQVFEEADAMAASPLEAEASHAPAGDSYTSIAREREEEEGDGGEYEAVVVAMAELGPAEVVSVALESPKKPRPVSPTDLVAAKLSAAAAAAAAAAAPLTNNLNSIGSSVSGFAQSAVPMVLVASQLQSAAAAGHSTAVATFATVSAALDSSMQRDKALKAARCKANPVEWFVADDTETHTRYIIIQGSDNFDHWKTNLTFDPVQFEGAELGVSVHRGVYETAAVLYERFEPLVAEHMASSPFAKVAFAGHSLGGSLATLLMLMYLRRGVLPAVAISPVYTFGAPAIFCEANCSCSSEGSAGHCHLADGSSVPEGPSGILQKLGLPMGTVRNVMMPKDIVPRAFACDYTLVADLLKRVGSSFREHSCLSPGSRVALYSAVGKQLLLQPDPSLTFVRGEGYHPMLPQEVGLFILQEPTIITAAAEASRLHSAWVDRPSRSTRHPAALVISKGPPSRNGRPATGPPVRSVNEAIAAVMDNPHPLETLADSGAYGTDGSISRYHNPDFYTLALASVVRSKPWWRSVGGTVGAGNGAGAGPRTYFTPGADRANRVSTFLAAAPLGAAVVTEPENKGGNVPSTASKTVESSVRQARSARQDLQLMGPVNNTLPYVKRLHTPAQRPPAVVAEAGAEMLGEVAPSSPRS